LKEDKDILDILNEVQLDDMPVNNSDWTNIESKYQSSQFYKWDIGRMNVYYAGLIAASFLGTLLIGTNFYSTKQKLESGYETRISGLEYTIDSLKHIHKTINEQPKSLMTVYSSNAGEVNNIKAESKQNKTTPKQNLFSKTNQINPRKSQDLSTKNLASNEEENPYLVKKIPENTSVSNHTEDLEPIEELQSKEEEALISMKQTNLDMDKSESLSNNKKIDSTKTKVQESVIIYLQDTIFEYDSTKVSRRKLKHGL